MDYFEGLFSTWESKFHCQERTSPPIASQTDSNLCQAACKVTVIVFYSTEFVWIYHTIQNVELCFSQIRELYLILQFSLRCPDPSVRTKSSLQITNRNTFCPNLDYLSPQKSRNIWVMTWSSILSWPHQDWATWEKYRGGKIRQFAPERGSAQIQSGWTESLDFHFPIVDDLLIWTSMKKYEL